MHYYCSITGMRWKKLKTQLHSKLIFSVVLIFITSVCLLGITTSRRVLHVSTRHSWACVRASVTAPAQVDRNDCWRVSHHSPPPPGRVVLIHSHACNNVFFTYSNGYLIMLNINAVTVIVGFRVCKEVTSKAQWFCCTCILVKQLFYCFFLELKHSLASEL